MRTMYWGPCSFAHPRDSTLVITSIAADVDATQLHPTCRATGGDITFEENIISCGIAPDTGAVQLHLACRALHGDESDPDSRCDLILILMRHSTQSRCCSTAPHLQGSGRQDHLKQAILNMILMWNST
jgi:hypothetical protein